MIGFFARHPVAANLFMIAGLIMGLTAVGGMERETFPEFSSSRVAVTVAYPGAAAEDVNQDVCLPLEEALQAI
ncbi:MAG: efflux RND transporter permease subunit, partial [Alphaproteobacteria bacterium]|nr:efflux RND transporter permease subunit [Alphaproteobacteria bacterium]